MIAGKVVVLLQARMESRRLPGKVLEPIAGIALLAHCIIRLQASGVGPVVVATTTLPADDAVVAAARQLGVSTFRGSSEDVLGRFIAAATAVGAEFVIRATADNPAVDPESPARLIERLRLSFADHVVDSGLPCGCTVEAVRTTALRDAAARSWEIGDREHVTTYLRRPGSGFKCVTVQAPPALHRPDLRFTVDTAGDLAYMRRVLESAGAANDRLVPIAALIAAADHLMRKQDVA